MMMNTTKILTGLAVLLVVSCTAQRGNRINGNGNVTTIERSTDDYDDIGVSGWFDVELVSGSEGALTLRGEENLLEYVETEVRNGKLSIKTKKGLYLKPSQRDGGILITVPVEQINSVAISGSGGVVGKTPIEANNLNISMSGSGNLNLQVDASSVDASMSGSGKMTLSGQAGDFDVSVSGSGDVRAFDLDADEVDAQISGSADIEVTAHKMLKARVSGSGDVEYRGNPEKIDSKVSGSGDISKS